MIHVAPEWKMVKVVGFDVGVQYSHKMCRLNFLNEFEKFTYGKKNGNGDLPPKNLST